LPRIVIKTIRIVQPLQSPRLAREKKAHTRSKSTDDKSSKIETRRLCTQASVMGLKIHNKTESSLTSDMSSEPEIVNLSSTKQNASKSSLRIQNVSESFPSIQNIPDSSPSKQNVSESSPRKHISESSPRKQNVSKITRLQNISELPDRSPSKQNVSDNSPRIRQIVTENPRKNKLCRSSKLRKNVTDFSTKQQLLEPRKQDKGSRRQSKSSQSSPNVTPPTSPKAPPPPPPLLPSLKSIKTPPVTSSSLDKKEKKRDAFDKSSRSRSVGTLNVLCIRGQGKPRPRLSPTCVSPRSRETSPRSESENLPLLDQESLTREECINMVEQFKVEINKLRSATQDMNNFAHKDTPLEYNHAKSPMIDALSCAKRVKYITTCLNSLHTQSEQQHFNRLQELSYKISSFTISLVKVFKGLMIEKKLEDFDTALRSLLEISDEMMGVVNAITWKEEAYTRKV